MKRASVLLLLSSVSWKAHEITFAIVIDGQTNFNKACFDLSCVWNVNIHKMYTYLCNGQAKFQFDFERNSENFGSVLIW